MASAAVEFEPHRHHQFGPATSKELGTGVLQWVDGDTAAGRRAPRRRR